MANQNQRVFPKLSIKTKHKSCSNAFEKMYDHFAEIFTVKSAGAGCIKTLFSVIAVKKY